MLSQLTEAGEAVELRMHEWHRAPEERPQSVGAGVCLSALD